MARARIDLVSKATSRGTTVNHSYNNYGAAAQGPAAFQISYAANNGRSLQDSRRRDLAEPNPSLVVGNNDSRDEDHLTDSSDVLQSGEQLPMGRFSSEPGVVEDEETSSQQTVYRLETTSRTATAHEPLEFYHSMVSARRKITLSFMDSQGPVKVVVEDKLRDYLESRDRAYRSKTLLDHGIVDLERDRATLIQLLGEKGYRRLKKRVVRQLPEAPPEFMDLLKPFRTKHENQSRWHEALAGYCRLQPGATIEEQTEYNYQDIVNTAIRQLMRLWRLKLLLPQHEENWYADFLWKDLLFQPLACWQGIEFRRGETTLEASAQRQSRGWSKRQRENDRQSGQPPPGLQVDSKILGYHGCEYAVIAAAGYPEHDDWGPKYDNDCAEMTRLLHDMMRRMETQAGTDFVSRSECQMIGCLLQGPEMSLFGLSHEGYLTFVYPLGKKKIISKTPDSMRDGLEVLEYVMRLKRHFSIIKNAHITQMEGNTDDKRTVSSPNLTPSKSPHRTAGAVGPANNPATKRQKTRV